MQKGQTYETEHCLRWKNRDWIYLSFNWWLFIDFTGQAVLPLLALMGHCCFIVLNVVWTNYSWVSASISTEHLICSFSFLCYWKHFQVTQIRQFWFKKKTNILNQRSAFFGLRLFLRYCQCSHEYIHVLRIETAKISFLEQLLKASSVHCFPRDKDDLTAEMILLARQF